MIVRLLHFLLPRNRLGDAIFSCLKFVKKHKRLPHPWKPATFNDHLLRMKVSGELYDPLRQLVSDKVLVKDYVRGVLGDGYTPQTLQILSTPEEIDALELSSPCVIKPAHAGKHVIISHDGSLDFDKSVLKQWLRYSYYVDGRAANYRYLKRRIIVEELLCNSDGSPVRDFKFFCFHGDPQMIQTDADRFTNHTRNLYSIDWEQLPFRIGYASHEVEARPDRLDDMLTIAAKLAAPFSLIRVDMYLVQGKIYVGELTNVPDDASRSFDPRHFDAVLAPLFAAVPLRDLAPMWCPEMASGLTPTLGTLG